MDKYMKETLRDLLEERDSIKKLRVYKIENEELWKIPILKDMALFKKGLPAQAGVGGQVPCGAGAVYGTGGALMNTTDYEVEEGADYEVQQGTEGAGVGR